MIILLLILGLIAFVVGIHYEEKTNSGGAFALTVIGMLAITGAIVDGSVAVVDAIDGRYIDDKIAMYQNENEKIESDIDVIVQQYMDHEGQTFDIAKVKSSTTLVQMYPELKSSEVVQKQMDIYYKNNEKIKKLELDKYKSKRARFILYFGGGR